MLPVILEYEEGRIKVTAEAYCIPEIKAILDKHDLQAEPYLAYVHLLTSPTSPYRNLPEEEMKESIIFDISQTLGDFDIDDELLQPALEKLASFTDSAIVLLAREMEQELHRLRVHLRNSEMTDENMKDRVSLMERIDKVATSYAKVKEQADKELEVKMRGKGELGDY